MILFIFISLTISQVKTDNEDETRGCMILEKEGACCWRHNNGCCAPPKEGTLCTQAFTNCCKIKIYDEETNTYEYKYEYENEYKKEKEDEYENEEENEYEKEKENFKENEKEMKNVKENEDENESEIPIIPINGNYYIKIIRFNLLLLILILF